MNKKTIIIVFGIIGTAIIITAIIWFARSSGKKFFSGTQNQSVNIAALQPQAVISLSLNGFEPKEVHLKVGGRVQWKNESGKIASVNSNPHPTNNAYRPLNLGQFSNGSTLQLVFTKKGTYGYHNYLNPSQQGTVIVE